MDLSMNMAILSQLTGSNGAAALNAAKVTAGDTGAAKQSESFQSLLSRLMNSDTTENKTLSQLKSLLNAGDSDETNVADLILNNDVMGTQYSLLSEKLVPGSMMMDAMGNSLKDNSTNELSGIFGSYGILNILQTVAGSEQLSTSEGDILGRLLGSAQGQQEQSVSELWVLNGNSGGLTSAAMMNVLAAQTMEAQLQEIADTVMAQANQGYDVTEIMAMLEGFNKADDSADVLSTLKAQLEALQDSRISQLPKGSSGAESERSKATGHESLQSLLGIVESKLEKAESSVAADIEGEHIGDDLKVNHKSVLTNDNSGNGFDSSADGRGNSSRSINNSAEAVPNVTFSDTVQAQTAAAGQVNGVGNAAEVNTAQPTSEPQPVYTQLSDEILKHIDSRGPTEFRMQLEPENLGKIDVALRMADGQLIIDIISQSSQTHSLLVSQVDRLIMNLGLHNVQVENVQVQNTQVTSEQSVHAIEGQLSSMNTDGFEKQRQQQFENRSRQNHTASMIDRNGDLSEMTDILGIMRDGSRRMDYMV